jgi:hypothetical protein
VKRRGRKKGLFTRRAEVGRFAWIKLLGSVGPVRGWATSRIWRWSHTSPRRAQQAHPRRLRASELSHRPARSRLSPGTADPRPGRQNAGRSAPAWPGAGLGDGRSRRVYAELLEDLSRQANAGDERSGIGGGPRGEGLKPSSSRSAAACAWLSRPRRSEGVVPHRRRRLPVSLQITCARRAEFAAKTPSYKLLWRPSGRFAACAGCNLKCARCARAL